MIYLAINNEQSGPYTPAQLQQMIARGEASVATSAWREGMAEWRPLGEVLGVGCPAGSVSGPPRTNGLAIGSFIAGLGVFLLGPLAGIPAVIMGHIARSQIRNSFGRLKGAGMALAGLILGYLGISVIPLAILAGIALPVFAAVKERGGETKCLTNAKSIGLACKLYASDHDGAFPPDLASLEPDYIPELDALVCPISKEGAEAEFEYFGGTASDPPQELLLQARHESRKGRKIVVYKDMSGEVMRGTPPQR